jgi:hypothetical protein
MKQKFLSILFLFTTYSFLISAQNNISINDTAKVHVIEVIDLDSLFKNIELLKTTETDSEKVELPDNLDTLQTKYSEKVKVLKDSFQLFVSPTALSTIKSDSLFYLANPFFIELIYMGLPFDFNIKPTEDLLALFHGRKASTLEENAYRPLKVPTSQESLVKLRQNARNEITRTAVGLYKKMFYELSNPYVKGNQPIRVKPIEKVEFVDENKYTNGKERKMYVPKFQVGPWRHKGSFLMQFSENYISKNWYQGGNSNLSVLGILTGQINYEDKKRTQWENNLEWRTGFYSVFGDTTALRTFNTNEDILKINSKLGFKASGNWFYSGAIDFSTQFLNNYQSVNSNALKAYLFTPVRLNVNFGMDYKYKKILSLMVSPLSLKYIYLSDTAKVNPNLFGIVKGENRLQEIGSSFKAVASYAPTREIQIDSKFTFYTNYQKIEADWEIVCNLIVNRFISTRISLNPRYDNTMIMAEGERAKVQFKQLLSVGFSHKF